MEKRSKIYPPRAFLHEWFEQRNGLLYWAKRPSRKVASGNLAGQRHHTKYPMITVPEYGRYALTTILRIMEVGNKW